MPWFQYLPALYTKKSLDGGEQPKKNRRCGGPNLRRVGITDTIYNTNCYMANQTIKRPLNTCESSLDGSRSARRFIILNIDIWNVDIWSVWMLVTKQLTFTHNARACAYGLMKRG